MKVKRWHHDTIRALLCLLIWASFSARSHAGKPSGATTEACSRDPQCLQAYQTARSGSMAGQYDAALVNYQIAYARVPAPLFLFNVARMQHRLGRLKDAVATYQKLLDDPASQKEMDLRAEAQRYQAQAVQELAAPPPPPLTPVTPPPLAPAADTPQAKPPLYKKWWLWTAVGVAAAGIAVGLGVGLTAAADARSVPPGVMILEPSFQ